MVKIMNQFVSSFEPDSRRVLTQDRAGVGFVRSHTGLRYDVGRGLWFEWNGTRWLADNKLVGIESAREYCRQLADQAKTAGGWAKEIESERFAASIEKIARSNRSMATATSEWDADEFLLGTPGGTVDLRRGHLRLANPDDKITRATLVSPATSANCPRWRKFLKEAIGDDDELIDYLQRFVGYGLTGVVREHALLFIHGPGGNGKSVFANVIGRLLKDYATVASFDTFTESKGDRHSAEIATLAGSRLVAASEPEKGKAWAESKVKLITGGDEISARFMHGNPFTFRPQFKLLFTANDKPILRSVNEAMRRRFHVVRFAYKPPVADTGLESNLIAYEGAPKSFVGRLKARLSGNAARAFASRAPLSRRPRTISLSSTCSDLGSRPDASKAQACAPVPASFGLRGQHTPQRAKSTQAINVTSRMRFRARASSKSVRRPGTSTSVCDSAEAAGM